MIGGILIVITSEYIFDSYKIGDHVYVCEIERSFCYGMDFGINNGRIWRLTIFDINDSPHHMLAEYRSGWITRPVNLEVEKVCDSLIEKYNYYNPILRESKY